MQRIARRTYMHELSIAMSLVDAVSEQLPALGDRARVSAVHVRIGALSGVAPESLRFSFDVVAAGSIIEGARLEIECVRTTIWCEGCGTEREAEDDRLLCTRCGQPSPRVVRGRELELAAVEVVDDADR